MCVPLVLQLPLGTTPSRTACASIRGWKRALSRLCPCRAALLRSSSICTYQLAPLLWVEVASLWPPVADLRCQCSNQQLYAFAPGLPLCQSLCPTAILAQTPVIGERLPLPSGHCLWARGACPVASACPSAARSWRSFSCSWRKHDVDATCIPPGREPSGRPIECIVPHLLMDSRPGPTSGVGCRLMTLLILLHCQVSHSVRVPALSVGAGEGNFFAYPRRLQVPKLNGIQATDGKQEPTHKWYRCVTRSFLHACNRAVRHGRAQPLYLFFFVSFTYLKSV